MLGTPRPGCLDVTVTAFAEGPRHPFLPGQGPSPTGRLGAWAPGQEGPPLPSPPGEARPCSPLSGRQVRSAPHSEQTRGESFSFSGSHQAFGGHSSWGHCCS